MKNQQHIDTIEGDLTGLIDTYGAESVLEVVIKYLEAQDPDDRALKDLRRAQATIRQNLKEGAGD